MTVPVHLWWYYSELWRTGLRHWTNYWSVTNNIWSVTTVLHHRSPRGTFFIRRVHVGPTVTYAWRLQFVIKVSTWSFFSMRHVPMGPFSIRPMEPDNLRVTCTYRACLHLHPTYGTCGLRVTCACGPFFIRNVGLNDIFLHLHPTYGTWRHLSPSPSDLWDPTTCVSRVPVGTFSISIWPVGPDGLRVTCGPFHHSIRGTRWLTYHVYLWDLSLSPSDLWDLMAYVSLVAAGV
jgi:hypothetical protein